MAQVKTFVFNDFQINTCLIIGNKNSCIIVDPGCYSQSEKDHLLKFISDNNLKPIMLVNTHAHVDHVLGNAFVKQHFDIPFYCNKKDEALLKSSTEQGIMFGFNAEPSPNIEFDITENDTLTIDGQTLEIFEVPGHSPGSIAIFSKDDGFIIAGDVLFKNSIGRTDLPGGDYNTLIASINNKLMPLDDGTIVYAGHGPATTIGNEKSTNPFLNQ